MDNFNLCLKKLYKMLKNVSNKVLTRHKELNLTCEILSISH